MHTKPNTPPQSTSAGQPSPATPGQLLLHALEQATPFFEGAPWLFRPEVSQRTHDAVEWVRSGYAEISAAIGPLPVGTSPELVEQAALDLELAIFSDWEIEYRLENVPFPTCDMTPPPEEVEVVESVSDSQLLLHALRPYLVKYHVLLDTRRTGARKGLAAQEWVRNAYSELLAVIGPLPDRLARKVVRHGRLQLEIAMWSDENIALSERVARSLADEEAEALGLTDAEREALYQAELAELVMPEPGVCRCVYRTCHPDGTTSPLSA